LRRGFLDVDVSLLNGGLEEVAQIKRDNPPAKSPLAKLFKDATSTKKDNDSESGSIGEDLDLESIGCTANVVMIDHAKQKIYVANAGDSRCVMGHGGKCTPLSFDHKPDG
jgi:serine/threonine protein phosphatase PrpC